MRVLIACEFSGTVRESFRCLGYDAVSCDLLPTEIPGPHYQGNVFDIINDGWDLMIAHPPCQYLSLAGNRYLKGNLFRQIMRQEAFEFFMRLYNSDIPYVAAENPRGYVNTKFRKPDQVIQPFQFGDPYRKLTCLWLRNLPALHVGGLPLFGLPGKDMPAPKPVYYRNDGQAIHFVEAAKTGGLNRKKLRSKTFPGIAAAMAEQWGGYVTERRRRHAS